MIFAALGFSANAQRDVKVNNNYNSVKQYVHVLNLSQSQVYDWSALNDYYDNEIYYVRNDRRLSAIAKSRKLDRLYDSKNKDIRRLLTNRQYRKFINLRSYNNRNV